MVIISYCVLQGTYCGWYWNSRPRFGDSNESLMSRRGRTCERTLGEFSTPASIERVTVGKLITRAEYYAWKISSAVQEMAWYISHRSCCPESSRGAGMTCLLPTRMHSFFFITAHARSNSDHCEFCGTLTRPQSSLGFLWMCDSRESLDRNPWGSETEGTHTKLQPGQARTRTWNFCLRQSSFNFQ